VAGADEFLQAENKTMRIGNKIPDTGNFRFSMSDNWAIDFKDLGCE
jgi:hypothetical protein